MPAYRAYYQSMSTGEVVTVKRGPAVRLGGLAAALFMSVAVVGRAGAAPSTAPAGRELEAGRLGIGLNSPGAGIRYLVSDRICVEARGQYLPDVIAAGPRACVYFPMAGFYPYGGLEGDYLSLNGDVAKGAGWGTSAFVGGEVFILRNVTFQLDFGPAYVGLKDTKSALSVGGIEFIVNLGITYYLGE